MMPYAPVYFLANFVRLLFGYYIGTFFAGATILFSGGKY